MKAATLQKKLARLEKSIDNMERGMYADMTPAMCVDCIVWLWQYRYIDHATMVNLSDRMTELFKYYL